jgi:hypothetical protein
LQRIRNQAARPRRARPATPPTTPPTIGPTDVDDCRLSGELVPEDGGCVDVVDSGVEEGEKGREDEEDKDEEVLEAGVEEKIKAVAM